MRLEITKDFARNRKCFAQVSDHVNLLQLLFVFWPLSSSDLEGARWNTQSYQRMPIILHVPGGSLTKKEHTRYTKARINSNKRKCPFSNSPECVSLHLKPLLGLTNTKAW